MLQSSIGNGNEFRKFDIILNPVFERQVTKSGTSVSRTDSHEVVSTTY